MNKLSFLSFLSLLIFVGGGLVAQNVGVGTATPVMKLHVQSNGAADGVIIDNIAANGDPVTQYRVNGASLITMGIDDSDADKFKIGTTALTTGTRVTIQTNGYIGVNTTTPTSLLHMTNGATVIGANAMARFENNSASGVALSARNNSTTSGYNAAEAIIDYNGTGFITAGIMGLAIYQGPINSNSIGVRAATNEWQGSGLYASRFNSGGPDNGWGAEVYNDLGYTGLILNMSDARTKKDIRPLEGAIAIVDQLNPVRYFFDSDKYPSMGLNREEEFGFVAQEVNQVLPNITRVKAMHTNACEEVVPGTPTENKKEEFMVMDYTRIIPILTQAIKEQQAEINDLEQKAAKVDALQAEVDALKSQLDAINQRLDRISNGQ